jgi:DNA (cytosine-5)-methyltransferase 1
MQTMHLFAGVGGGLLADRILGHNPIIAVEWEPYACQILRERAADGWFPDLQVWEGDVRLFDPSEYTGRVDCIHAGFPCTDISVAGKQAGVGPETRSGLYREVLRIAGVVRPRYLFLENVAAIVSNGLGTVIADLIALGYDSEWLCLRASDCGANHHRDRWWLLAESNGESWWTHAGARARTEEEREELFSKNREALPSTSEEVCRDVADTKCLGLQGQGELVSPVNQEEAGNRETTELVYGGVGDFWGVEPDVGRVANGIPARVHRLKGLGNAQVPLQAAVAWKLLGGP